MKCSILLVLISLDIHMVAFLVNVKRKLFHGLRIFRKERFVWNPFVVLLWFYIVVQCLGLSVGTQNAHLV